MKIAIIFGTHPEIIKISPIIRECEKLGINHYILHTGQHYSFEMERVCFDELNLPAARFGVTEVNENSRQVFAVDVKTSHVRLHGA